MKENILTAVLLLAFSQKLLMIPKVANPSVIPPTVMFLQTCLSLCKIFLSKSIAGGKNICSDLDAFARDKLLESANHAPHASPQKKSYNSGLVMANNTAAIEAKLKSALYFHTPQGQELHKLNETIISVDTQS